MRIWVLGASDPEMAAIERLLRDNGETIVHATVSGRRASPGEAYQCDPVPDGTHWVECAPRGGRPEGALVIDHHKPGDPGYGRPPSDYWAASSLGQVWAALGRDAGEATPEMLMTAAADHCLAAAYRGLCPGVNPEALMRWRAESRAAFQRRSVADVLTDVERARERLRSAHRICLSCGNRCASGEPECACGSSGSVVADLRGEEIPELTEAAAREGVAFLATPKPGPDGRKKVVLQCANATALAAWQAWAKAQGLCDLYGGDPERGFAGGYLP